MNIIDPTLTFRHSVKKDNGIDIITVKRSDGFKVVLTDLGASLYEVYFNDKLMTLTPKYMSDFKNPKLYHGKTIGRYANRIKDAKLFVAGQIFNLDPNEGKNTLHSGSMGFSNRYFDYEFRETENYFAVVFKYISPELEAGFPGEMDVKVAYLFHKLQTANFQILFEAKTTYETVFRPTNHAYFSLGNESIEDVGLYINSDRYVVPDKDTLLPKRMEKLIPELDFDSNCYAIKKGLVSERLLNTKAHGIDHYFRFKNNDNQASPVILLTDKSTTLTIHTNFDGVHIYSDNYEDDIVYKNTKKKVHRGLAIEPCDSPLKQNVLKPGEIFHKGIFYFFHEVK